MKPMTTGGFYGMYQEEYQTQGGGPALITVVGDQVKWSLTKADRIVTGSVPLDEHGQEAGLAKARKAVDAALLSEDNPPAAGESASVVAEPPSGTDTLTPPAAEDNPE